MSAIRGRSCVAAEHLSDPVRDSVTVAGQQRVAAGDWPGRLESVCVGRGCLRARDSDGDRGAARSRVCCVTAVQPKLQCSLQ